MKFVQFNLHHCKAVTTVLRQLLDVGMADVAFGLEPWLYGAKYEI
jgi:hypothetical protein